MDATTIEQDVLIDAPLEDVWRLLGAPDQLQRWFADLVEVELAPGRSGTFGFQDRATHATATVPFTVDRVDPPTTLAFRWMHADGRTPEAGGSILVRFDLEEEGSGTRLRLTESGLDRPDWTAQQREDYRREHVEGWRTHLRRLQACAAGSSAASA